MSPRKQNKLEDEKVKSLSSKLVLTRSSRRSVALSLPKSSTLSPQKSPKSKAPTSLSSRKSPRISLKNGSNAEKTHYDLSKKAATVTSPIRTMATRRTPIYIPHNQSVENSEEFLSTVKVECGEPSPCHSFEGHFTEVVIKSEEISPCYVDDNFVGNEEDPLDVEVNCEGVSPCNSPLIRPEEISPCHSAGNSVPNQEEFPLDVNVKSEEISPCNSPLRKQSLREVIKSKSQRVNDSSDSVISALKTIAKESILSSLQKHQICTRNNVNTENSHPQIKVVEETSSQLKLQQWNSSKSKTDAYPTLIKAAKASERKLTVPEESLCSSWVPALGSVEPPILCTRGKPNVSSSPISIRRQFNLPEPIIEIQSNPNISKLTMEIQSNPHLSKPTMEIRSNPLKTGISSNHPISTVPELNGSILRKKWYALKSRGGFTSLRSAILSPEEITKEIIRHSKVHTPQEDEANFFSTKLMVRLSSRLPPKRARPSCEELVELINSKNSEGKLNAPHHSRRESTAIRVKVEEPSFSSTISQINGISSQLGDDIRVEADSVQSSSNTNYISFPSSISKMREREIALRQLKNMNYWRKGH